MIRASADFSYMYIQVTIKFLIKCYKKDNLRTFASLLLIPIQLISGLPVLDTRQSRRATTPWRWTNLQYYIQGTYLILSFLQLWLLRFPLIYLQIQFIGLYCFTSLFVWTCTIYLVVLSNEIIRFTSV